MEEKYAIYIVDPSDVDGDISELGYDEVKNLAVDYYKGDDMEELLRQLVGGLNDDSISDQNFFYVTDEENGIILFGR